MEKGVGLQEALDEFISDLRLVVKNGGRVCAHNLEFDATIVLEEMSRVKMDEQDLVIFESAIYNGFCTMNPTLTRWCCEEYLRNTSKYGYLEVDKDVPVPLRELVRVLDVDTQKLCLPAHDAEADARAVWLILRELHRLATSS